MIIVEDPVTGIYAAPQHLADISCPNNCEHEVHLLLQPVLQYADVSTFRRGFAQIQQKTDDSELFRYASTSLFRQRTLHHIRVGCDKAIKKLLC